MNLRGVADKLRETHLDLGSDGLLHVQLNRPQQGNAYTARMADELDHIFKAADADPACKVVILSGRGKYFCAGADLNSGPEALDARRDHGGTASLSIWQCRKPVIAALHGAAVGIGVTLTLPCDLRVVEENTKVAFAFARRGLTVEAAASFFLPRLVGHGKASELCLTGRTFRAKEEPSLFTAVVPAGQALQRAEELAREMLVHCSPASLTYVKRSLNSPRARTPEGAHELESLLIRHCFASQDFAEGIASFFGKRAPSFPSSANDTHPELDRWADWPPAYPARSKL